METRLYGAASPSELYGFRWFSTSVRSGAERSLDRTDYYELSVSLSSIYIRCMATRATGLNSSVLTWAREELGLSLADVAEAIGRPAHVITAWEAGEEHPTWNQLESLAKLFRRPVAVFFFPEPPTEIRAESEFRTVINLHSDDLEPDTRLAVREGRAWQQSLRELAGPSNPASRFILRDVVMPVDVNVAGQASLVREYVGVPLAQQQRWRNTTSAFKQWRAAVEDVGVFVFKRSFNQDSISGFCLHDPQFPVIVINNSTSHARQIFTLFHELAHVLFRVSGITYEADTRGNPAVTPLERACDNFAHEFLVPTQGFDWNYVRTSRDIVGAIESMANHYKVSRLVILRKIHDHGDIPTTVYRELNERFTAEYLARRAGEATGGSYYANQATYLGDAYLTLAFDQLHRGRVTVPELADHLAIKARNLGKLEDFILARK